MIGLPDPKTPLLWVLGLGLVAALGVAGIEHTRAAGARADAATARRDLANYRSTVAEAGRLAERAARTQEQTWRDRLEGVTRDGQVQAAADRLAAERAGASERRVRQQLSDYRSAVRAAAAASGDAGGSPPAEAALDMLADLLGRSGSALVELGRFADAAHTAGAICDRANDALTSDLP